MINDELAYMLPDERAYIQNCTRVTDICLAARAMREADASLTHRESLDRARVVVAARIDASRD
jgi:hypothetical protein